MTIDGVERLRAFAKAKRLRVHECWMFTANAPEAMVARANRTVDGGKLKLFASPSTFVVDLYCTTELVFSVGAPNRVFSQDGPPTFVSAGSRPVWVSDYVKPQSKVENWLPWPPRRPVA